MDRHADDLKALLEKLLDRMPEEVRLAYPSYAKAREPDLSPAEIEKQYGEASNEAITEHIGQLLRDGMG